jgi:trk system potassium uptake protein TrkA
MGVMRVIVIGLGEVGQHVAQTLSGERHDVTVVDQDQRRVEGAQGDLDALVVVGNGASPKFLRDLGAGDADLVCAVTQSDEVNVIAALAARQLGAARTVARVRDDDYFGTDESFARDVLGIDVVIHPERATAEDLAEAILLPGAVHVERFADGRVVVAEIALTSRSPLIGQALANRRMVRPHSIFGVIREGRAVAADPAHRLRVGDHVLMAAARDDAEAVVAHLAGRVSRVRDVIVFGGGRIGLPLARQLESAERFNVIVMERDEDRARYIAERLRRTTVLHEEGVSKDALLAHGVDRAGAFVAAAGDDRANLLAALNAKQLGAGVCLAVVSREEFTPLVDALGIDAGFSPRLVTAEAILRAVRGGDVEEVHLLLGGAEILDVHVDLGCAAEGRTVGDTASMARTRVAAIARNGKVLFPEGSEAVHGGDRLVTFNARQGVSDVAGAFKAA